MGDSLPGDKDRFLRWLLNLACVAKSARISRNLRWLECGRTLFLTRFLVNDLTQLALVLAKVQRQAPKDAYVNHCNTSSSPVLRSPPTT